MAPPVNAADDQVTEDTERKGTLRPVNATTEDDIQLISRLRTMFEQARKAKRPMVAQWMKNYKIMRNRTWISGRADWLPSPEVPEIYPIMCSFVGWITDQRPSFEVLPAAEPHSPFYNFMSSLAWDLQTVMHANFQVGLTETEIEKSLWDTCLYGTGFIKTSWDDALDNGMGNVAVRRVDPFTIYPDPTATSPLDMTYIIEARKMSLQELDRRFPGAADKFRNGAGTDAVDEAPSRSDSTTTYPKANAGPIAPATSPRYGLPGQARDRANTSNDLGTVTVFECWLREHEFSDKDEDDDQDVYDYWRVVVFAGNYVLMDEKAEDLWGHCRHPYTRNLLHDTGEFWGFSLVEMLAPSQLAINRLLASMQLNIELVGNPVFKEGARSGIQRTKITNRPGQRVTVAEGSQADWLQPPPLSPQVMELLRFYIGEMERVSGLSAITRGATPQGRNSSDTLDSVQEASFVRIRMALRQLEYTLREVGNLAASLITEFYDTPRFVATTGPSGEQLSLALHGQHFYIPTDEGREPMKYSLLVNAGSQLPTSSSARRADATTLFAMGALDVPAVLEAFNWPNRDIVSQRIQAAQAAGTFQPPGARQRSQRSS